MGQEERRRRLRWIREFWSLAKPYWTSSEKGWALGCLSVIVVITLSVVYLSVRLNRWYQEFYDVATASTPASVYYRFLLQYCWIAGIWISIERLSSYLKYRLRLRWREWMTREFVSLWLRDQNHYFWTLTQSSTDNPDQRIAEDIQLFIQLTLSLSLDLLGKVVTLFSFLGVLWGLSGILRVPLGAGAALSLPGYLVWASVTYAVVSNTLVFLVGRQLVPLQYEQQHLEADFRFGLIRTRENSEGIALARGDDAEIRTANKLFSRVVANFRTLIRKFIQVEMFDSAHGQVRSLFPLFVAGPRVLSGAIKVGGLFQISNAFEKVESSISFLVSSFQSVSQWRSAARRLADLEESLRRAAAVRERAGSGHLERPDGAAVRLNEVELLTPQGRKLLDRLNLEIRQGEKLLFKGSSGVGKSTLFRALAGIWPFFHGTFEVPPPDSRLFLSQSPYLPQGTLRDAIFYPRGAADVPDLLLQKHLDDLGLAHLRAKLDAEGDWSQILSPGEKQRIIIIRALVLRPKWLFLDEATAALDDENSVRAYEKLKAELPDCSLVSIGHRADIARFHDRSLGLGPAGGGSP